MIKQPVGVVGIITPWNVSDEEQIERAEGSGDVTWMLGTSSRLDFRRWQRSLVMKDIRAVLHRERLKTMKITPEATSHSVIWTYPLTDCLSCLSSAFSFTTRCIVYPSPNCPPSQTPQFPYSPLPAIVIPIVPLCNDHSENRASSRRRMYVCDQSTGRDPVQWISDDGGES